MNKICVICGKEFEPHGPTITCGKQCSIINKRKIDKLYKKRQRIIRGRKTSNTTGIVDMNNKQSGNEFEREFCEMLSKDGFWSHFMGGSKNVQPADIIAVRNKKAYLIDVKE